MLVSLLRDKNIDHSCLPTTDSRRALRLEEDIQKLKDLKMRASALGSRSFDDYGAPFVVGDHAIKLSQLLDFFRGDAKFFDFNRSRVADNTSNHLCLGMIAGEAVVHIDGGRQLASLVTVREGDFKAIGVPYRPIELNWKGARLFGLQKA